jgi:phosphohistidine swiveling domain-containing protein
MNSIKTIKHIVNSDGTDEWSELKNHIMQFDIGSSKDPLILTQEKPMISIFYCFIMYYMVNWWFEYHLTSNFKNFIGHYNGTHVKMYLRKSEYEKSAKDVANKIINNPSWALKKLKEIEKSSKKFILNSRKLSSLKENDKKLLSQFRKTNKYHFQSQIFGAAFTWLTEARYELVTKKGIEIIKKQIKKKGLKEKSNQLFNILTQTKKKSFLFNEEIDFLKIIEKIQSNPIIKKKFLEKSKKSLIKYVLEKKDDISKHIINYYNKWSWLSYGYIGPERELESYVKDIKKEIVKKIKPKEIIRNNKIKDNNIKTEQKKLLKQLSFKKKDLKLIEFIKETSFIKDYRKGALYHGLCHYEKFFDVLSKKLDIEKKLFFNMNPFEIEELLEGKSISLEELKKREKDCIFCYKKNKITLVYDNEAKKILKSMIFESPKENLTELKGTPVCAGFVKGKAKIIESIDDLKKMQKGDILISHITYPNLMPGMKKAAAIVTNVGGLISHAAIVAREMNIPCVVGTKFATKVFKDGDLVEVDADKGIVRKIK